LKTRPSTLGIAARKNQNFLSSPHRLHKLPFSGTWEGDLRLIIPCLDPPFHSPSPFPSPVKGEGIDEMTGSWIRICRIYHF
jgi:hypothetical protein